MLVPEPFNPFDTSEKENFPDLQEGLAPGVGPEGSVVDIDQLSRQPADIDTQHPPDLGFLPPETSQLLQARCHAWFEQQTVLKATRGDSPTPSCDFNLPGIPFRDEPRHTAAEAAAQASTDDYPDRRSSFAFTVQHRAISPTHPFLQHAGHAQQQEQHHPQQSQQSPLLQAGPAQQQGRGLLDQQQLQLDWDRERAIEELVQLSVQELEALLGTSIARQAAAATSAVASTATDVPDLLLQAASACTTQATGSRSVVATQPLDVAVEGTARPGAAAAPADADADVDSSKAGVQPSRLSLLLQQNRQQLNQVLACWQEQGQQQQQQEQQQKEERCDLPGQQHEAHLPGLQGSVAQTQQQQDQQKQQDVPERLNSPPHATHQHTLQHVVLQEVQQIQLTEDSEVVGQAMQGQAEQRLLTGLELAHPLLAHDAPDGSSCGSPAEDHQQQQLSLPHPEQPQQQEDVSDGQDLTAVLQDSLTALASMHQLLEQLQDLQLQPQPQQGSARVSSLQVQQMPTSPQATDKVADVSRVQQQQRVQQEQPPPHQGQQQEPPLSLKERQTNQDQLQQLVAHRLQEQQLQQGQTSRRQQHQQQQPVARSRTRTRVPGISSSKKASAAGPGGSRHRAVAAPPAAAKAQGSRQVQATTADSRRPAAAAPAAVVGAPAAACAATGATTTAVGKQLPLQASAAAAAGSGAGDGVAIQLWRPPVPTVLSPEYNGTGGKKAEAAASMQKRPASAGARAAKVLPKQGAQHDAPVTKPQHRASDQQQDRAQEVPAAAASLLHSVQAAWRGLHQVQQQRWQQRLQGVGNTSQAPLVVPGLQQHHGLQQQQLQAVLHQPGAAGSGQAATQPHGAHDLQQDVATQTSPTRPAAVVPASYKTATAGGTALAGTGRLLAERSMEPGAVVAAEAALAAAAAAGDGGDWPSDGSWAAQVAAAAAVGAAAGVSVGAPPSSPAAAAAASGQAGWEGRGNSAGVDRASQLQHHAAVAAAAAAATAATMAVSNLTQENQMLHQQLQQQQVLGLPPPQLAAVSSPAMGPVSSPQGSAVGWAADGPTPGTPHVVRSLFNHRRSAAAGTARSPAAAGVATLPLQQQQHHLQGLPRRQEQLLVLSKPAAQQLQQQQQHPLPWPELQQVGSDRPHLSPMKAYDSLLADPTSSTSSARKLTLLSGVLGGSSGSTLGLMRSPLTERTNNLPGHSGRPHAAAAAAAATTASLQAAPTEAEVMKVASRQQTAAVQTQKPGQTEQGHDGIDVSPAAAAAAAAAVPAGQLGGSSPGAGDQHGRAAEGDARTAAQAVEATAAAAAATTQHAAASWDAAAAVPQYSTPTRQSQTHLSATLPAAAAAAGVGVEAGGAVAPVEVLQAAGCAVHCGSPALQRLWCGYKAGFMSLPTTPAGPAGAGWQAAPAAAGQAAPPAGRTALHQPAMQVPTAAGSWGLVGHGRGLAVAAGAGAGEMAGCVTSPERVAATAALAAAGPVPIAAEFYPPSARKLLQELLAPGQMGAAPAAAAAVSAEAGVAGVEASSPAHVTAAAGQQPQPQPQLGSSQAPSVQQQLELLLEQQLVRMAQLQRPLELSPDQAEAPARHQQAARAGQQAKPLLHDSPGNAGSSSSSIGSGSSSSVNNVAVHRRTGRQLWPCLSPRRRHSAQQIREETREPAAAAALYQHQHLAARHRRVRRLRIGSAASRAELHRDYQHYQQHDLQQQDVLEQLYDYLQQQPAGLAGAVLSAALHDPAGVFTAVPEMVMRFLQDDVDVSQGRDAAQGQPATTATTTP